MKATQEGQAEAEAIREQARREADAIKQEALLAASAITSKAEADAVQVKGEAQSEAKAMAEAQSKEAEDRKRLEDDMRKANLEAALQEAAAIKQQALDAKALADAQVQQAAAP